MQVRDELLEDERVNVLAELVEQEPVADAELAADRFNLKFFQIREKFTFFFDRYYLLPHVLYSRKKYIFHISNLRFFLLIKLND